MWILYVYIKPYANSFLDSYQISYTEFLRFRVFIVFKSQTINVSVRQFDKYLKNR